MTVRVTPQAHKHLRNIAHYIRRHNPAASQGVRSRIRQTLSALGRFPHMGHLGADPATREVTVPQLPYIVVHTVSFEGDVYIIGIYHGAQLRPGQVEPDAE